MTLDYHARPPERFHAFISYTTREEEIALMKPVLDRFLNDYLRPTIEARLGESPVFYDGWYLRNTVGVRRDENELKRSLHFALDESELLLAFVSPRYLGSPWCQLEYEGMANKTPRAWYDICREAPAPELLDRRPLGARPSHLRCVEAALARWRQGRRGVPGDLPWPIVTIVWKGEDGFDPRLPLTMNAHVFDWRGCGRFADIRWRNGAHKAKHGSVSPSWEEEANEAWSVCIHELQRTAECVAQILQTRRSRYRRAVEGL